MVWLRQFPENSSLTPGNCIYPSLDDELSWTNIAQGCILLSFCGLQYRTSSLRPSFLSLLHLISPVLLSFSLKYQQTCSFFSLLASVALARATAASSGTIALGSFLQLSHSSNQDHGAQLGSLYTAHSLQSCAPVWTSVYLERIPL